MVATLVPRGRRTEPGLQSYLVHGYIRERSMLRGMESAVSEGDLRYPPRRKASRVAMGCTLHLATW